MAGPHAQFRTPSKPLVVGGEVILRQPSGPMDWQSIRRILTPGGLHKDGRCVDWNGMVEVKPFQVLDHHPAMHRPSKNARGRIRPRTAAEQAQFQRRQARLVQLQKTMTVNATQFGAIYDEVPGGLG